MEKSIPLTLPCYAFRFAQSPQRGEGIKRRNPAIDGMAVLVEVRTGTPPGRDFAKLNKPCPYGLGSRTLQGA
jgi:hypothetical protein